VATGFIIATPVVTRWNTKFIIFDVSTSFMDKTYYLRVALLCQSLNLAAIHTNIIPHLPFQLSVVLCSFLSKGHRRLFIQFERSVFSYSSYHNASAVTLCYLNTMSSLLSFQILRIVTKPWW